MTHQVFMTNDARDDLIDIIEYIQSNDSKDSADYVLEQIETTVKTLSQDPERGSHPRELVKIGILQYREIYFKPYRIIYEVLPKKVQILLIADGRRNLQTLLYRRMIKATK